MRSELSHAARDAAVQALAAISSDRFWAVMSPDGGETAATHTVEVEPGDRDEIRDALMSLVSGSLVQILNAVGYRPPPPSWDVVAAARRAADEAITFGLDVDYTLVRRDLNRLLTALSLLSLDNNDEKVGSVFARTKAAVFGGAVLASVILGQIDGVLDDVRHEVVYPAVVHVWGEIMDRDTDPEPSAPSPVVVVPVDDELREIHLATDRARLAEAQARAAEAAARAEIARLEEILMRERVEEERNARDY